MKNELSVGAVQFRYDEDSKPYYNKINEIIECVDLSVLDLICFPELCVYGFDYRLMEELCDEEVNEQFRFFQDMADKNDLIVVAGLFEREGSENFDSVVVFDSEGEIVQKYKKTHLWGGERDFFTHGSTLKLFEADGWKIGVGICADLGFPELSRKLALKGAEFIIYPSAWQSPYLKLWKQMITARAAENQAFVLGVNAVGSDNHYCGGTLLTNPKGDIVEELKRDENFLSVKVDKQMVYDRREEIDWLSMVREDVYRH